MLLFLGFRQNVSRETFFSLFPAAHSQIYFNISKIMMIPWAKGQKAYVSLLARGFSTS